MMRQRGSDPCLPAGRWQAAWCAAMQVVQPENALASCWERDSVLRQIVRAGAGGRQWRLRLSNRFGAEPLRIAAASLAPAHAPGQPGIDEQHLRMLRFGGAAEVTIAPGCECTSDEVALDVDAFADLAVTLALRQLPGAQTGHPGSRATAFVARGQDVGAATLPHSEPVEHGYLISDLEAWAEGAEEARAVLAACGDSITDGRGSTTDGNDRWTDLLRLRGAAEGRPWVIVNTALGGNRLLHDGIGHSLRSRFERDVLARSGVRAAVLQIGINDLGTRRENGFEGAAGRERFIAEMIAAWRELAAAARARGVWLIGATLAPFVGHPGYQPGADDEADRCALNAAIRAGGLFDAVADFDLALRDPGSPQQVREGLHCGDHLHPSPAGMQALADAVPWPLQDA